MFILNGSPECTECSKNCTDMDRDFCSTFQVTPAPDAKAVAFEKALDVFSFPGKKICENNNPEETLEAAASR